MNSIIVNTLSKYNSAIEKVRVRSYFSLAAIYNSTPSLDLNVEII